MDLPSCRIINSYLELRQFSLETVKKQASFHMKINNISSFILLVGIGVWLTIGGDIFLKKSDLLHLRYFAFGVMLYAIAATPVALAFKFTQFSVLFVVWEALTIILGFFAGIFLFGEAVTWNKILGLVLAVAAVLITLKS